MAAVGRRGVEEAHQPGRQSGDLAQHAANAGQIGAPVGAPLDDCLLGAAHPEIVETQIVGGLCNVGTPPGYPVDNLLGVRGAGGRRAQEPLQLGT